LVHDQDVFIYPGVVLENTSGQSNIDFYLWLSTEFNFATTLLKKEKKKKKKEKKIICLYLDNS